jgi:hypothetical protein
MGWSTRFIMTSLLFALMVGSGRGQELAFEVRSYDTSIYDYYGTIVYQGIEQLRQNLGSWPNPQTYSSFQGCMYNKKTDQFDVFLNQIKSFSFSKPNPPINSYITPSIVSQTVFNSDKSWEILWEVYDTVSMIRNRFLTNANGTTIWTPSSDEFSPQPCYDGIYTYINVLVRNNASVSSRYYRFHPAASAIGSSLSKSALVTQTPAPMINFSSSGDCKIKLTRSMAGATTVSLYNLIGQQLFSQTVSDLKKDVFFSIPAQSIPGSPIITKVQNNQGISITKSIPLQ